MFSSLTSTPKIAPTGKKKYPKRPKIWPNEKQKDRAVLQKQKLIVYISRFQKCFWAWPRPKNSPNGQKKITLKGSKSKKRPNIWPNLKQKDRAVLPKQKLIVYIRSSKNVFEPDLEPKNSPNGPKKQAWEAISSGYSSSTFPYHFT